MQMPFSAGALLLSVKSLVSDFVAAGFQLRFVLLAFAFPQRNIVGRPG